MSFLRLFRQVCLFFPLALFLPFLQAQENNQIQSKQVVVAVIDSGVLAEHPNLKERTLPGYDMISPPFNLRGSRSNNFSPDLDDATANCWHRVPMDYHSHGTEISSLIAGNGYEGVFGVNQKAKILPIRLFGICGNNRVDLLDAMSWAAGLEVKGIPLNPNPARVINLSFSGRRTVCGDDLQSLISTLLRKNVFIVVAAGNRFGKPITEPANCNGVISVGSLNGQDHIAYYSAVDSRITLYASSGENLKASSFFIASQKNNTKEKGTVLFPRAVQGTSYSAALFSGFVSLLLLENDKLTPHDLLGFLFSQPKTENTFKVCTDCPSNSLYMTFKPTSSNALTYDFQNRLAAYTQK